MRPIYQMALIGACIAGGYVAAVNWDAVKPHLPSAVTALVSGSAAPVAGTPGRPAAPGGGGAGAPPPVVEVLPVGTGTVVETVEAVGTTRAFESITVTSKVAGLIEALTFDEGQTVVAGQELVRMDGAERQADLEAARAQIAQEEAKRNELRTKLERAIALRRSGAGTEAQADDLTAQVKTSDSAVQAAISRERAAQARLNDIVIRAPFTGRVGVRQVSPGAYLESKTVVTTLDDVSRIRIDFSVPENLIARLGVGSTVAVQAPAFGARKFPGTVSVVDTRIDVITRAVKMTALIENPDGTLRPGMFMNVGLEVARRENAILVPEEALVGEGPLQLAFVVKDGRIERRVLTIGQRQEGKVEVVAGVSPGETLVVRGVQRVRAGIQVNVRPLGAPAVAPSAAAPQASASPASASPVSASPAAAPSGGGAVLIPPAQAAPAQPANAPQTR